MPTGEPAATGPVVGPAGTQAIAVHSDLRCPWAHVAVHRLLGTAERLGVADELVVDHRWFPLGEDATPQDPAALDRELAAIGALEPDAGWTEWSGRDVTFPTSARTAAAWVQAAKATSPQASTVLDRALRRALFAGGRDIADESVIADVASGLDGVDVDAVRREVASGRPDAELDRQAEVASSDAIPASPTIVVAGGNVWVNPGIEFDIEGGVPQIRGDDPSVYDEIIETFLAARQYD